MKYFDWNEEENQWLKKERNISFEVIVSYLEQKKMLDKIAHPNSVKYPDQFIFVIEHDNYAYLVPFVEDDEKVFLKTIIPSRRVTEKYLRRKSDG